MGRLSLRLTPTGEHAAENQVFDVPDLPTALVVTDINLATGTAEIWQEEKRLASLYKRPGTPAGAWEVG